jgi:hypothetical protein
MVGLEALFEDVGRGRSRVDHFDARAVEHDLFDHTFAQIERAEDAVTVFFFDHTFGMAQLQGTGNLFAYCQDVAVGVHLDPEQAQDATDQKPDGRHDR